MTFDTSARWLVGFAALVLALSTAIVWFNYSMDFYGLFRDPQGRAIRVYANDRTSKYLFGYRYIPVDFDGILIGSSISANWDVSKIETARVYNASISGGNITEEKLIADNVLARGHMKLVIFVIQPYLTASHGPKTGFMNPREYRGALGSVGLLRVYARYIEERFDMVPHRYDEYGKFNGTEDAVVRRPLSLGASPREHVVSRKEAFIDESAFEEYRQLVETARAKGARIVAFIPPIYAPRYEARKAEFDEYIVRVSSLFQPSESIVNFNSPNYLQYTGNPSNFYDGTHLSASAADFFSKELAIAIKSRREGSSLDPSASARSSNY